MSYNDLNQVEKRSLLLNAVAFNRVCEYLAYAEKDDVMMVKEVFMADAQERVLSLSDKQIDSIIAQIQIGLDNKTEATTVNIIRVEIKE